MKKFLLFLCGMLCSIPLFSQLVVYDIDTTDFPRMKAKVLVVNKRGEIIENLKKEDFKVFEDGIPRDVLSVSCSQEKQTQSVSAVLCIDVSGSMGVDRRLEFVKKAALLWVDLLDTKNSECAVTSFDHQFYLNQGFTTNKDLLRKAISSLVPNGGTDYNVAFLGPVLGSIGVASTGRYNRVIIFLSDGEPNFEPDTWKIIFNAVQNKIQVFSIVVGIPSTPSLKEITLHTGGVLYEKVKAEDELSKIFIKILQLVHRFQFCEIEWMSDQKCFGNSHQVEMQYIPENYSQKFDYMLPPFGSVFLKPTPLMLRIGEKPVGVPFDTQITITAVNRRFEVTDVISSNPDFVVNPKQFALENGESIQINITYTPKDSGYTYTQLTFVDTFCPLNYFVVVGFPKRTKENALMVVQPNGGEVFGLGSDTIISWKNLPPTDTVVIEYSTNSGVDWVFLTDSATGLVWKWSNIPPPASNKCLVRITRKEERGKILEPFSIDWSLRYDGEVFSWHPSNEFIAFSDFSRIKILNRNLEKVGILWGHDEKITGLKFSRDGKYLVSCGSDFKINVWETYSWIRKLQIISKNDQFANNSLTAIDISPNSRFLATGSANGNLNVWDLSSGNLVTSLSTLSSKIGVLEFSPDGKYLAASNNLGQIYVWRTDNWNLATKLSPWNSYTYIEYFPIKFNNDGKILFAVTNSGLFGYDTESWSVVKEIPLDGQAVTAIAINSLDDLIALGTMGSGIYFYDLKNGYNVARLTLKFIVDHIEITENDTLITFSTNGVISFYSSQDIRKSPPQKIGEISKPNSVVKSVKFLQDNSLLTYTDYSTVIESCDLLLEYKSWRTMQKFYSTPRIDFAGKGFIYFVDLGFSPGIHYSNPSKKIEKAFEYSWSVAYLSDFSLDNRYLILIGWRNYYNTNYNIIHLYDFVDLKMDTFLITSEFKGYYVKFDPNSKFAYVGVGNKVYELDLSTKELKEIISVPNFVISYISISSDGNYLVAAFNDVEEKNGKIIVYSILGKKIIFDSINFSAPISYLELSPSDLFLVVLFKNSRFFKILETGTFVVVADVPEAVGNLVTCARFTPDGKFLLEGTSAGYLIIRNTYDWTQERIIAAHSRQINSMDISFDGKYLATCSNDRNVIIWNLAGNLDMINSDISDSVFSIVPSRVQGKNVDMGIAVVGIPKDSVVQDFVVNTGKFRTRVDTIFLRSYLGTPFKIVTGGSGGTLEPGEGLDVEFMFFPSLGYSEGEIIVVSNGDTSKYLISGFGIAPVFGNMRRYLDFGKIMVGDSSTIYDTTLIVNMSDEVVSISDVKIEGLDADQFVLVDGGGPFTLLPNEGRKFTVRFVPKYFGLLSSTILLYHDKVGSPEKIRLFGEGVGGKFRIPDDSGYAGERKNIVVRLEKITPKGLSKGAKRFEFTLKYQKTILSPPSEGTYEIIGDSVFTTVSGLIDSTQETIVSIPVTFALGTTPQSKVEFANITLYDYGGYPIAYDFERENGHFKLLGLCEEGGRRLVNPESKIGIENLQFNNSTNEYEIDFYIAESGVNKIEVYNLLGELVTVLFDENPTNFGKKKVAFSAELLPKGVYLLIFKTPSKVETLPFVCN